MLKSAFIDDHWNWIFPCLLTVKRKGNAEWTPEDIRRACLEDRASLFLGEGSDFVVLKVLNYESGERRLFVWAAHGKNPKRYIPALEEMARDIDAVAIEMISPRKGFARMGWVPKHIVYEWRL